MAALRVYLYNQAGAAARALEAPKGRAGSPVRVGARLSLLRGYADATITLVGLPSQIEGLALGRRIELRTSAGLRLFRGYIVELSPRGQRGNSPAQTEVTLYGIAQRAARQVTMQRYLWPGGKDIAGAFAVLCNRWVLPEIPGLGIFTQDTGQVVDALDAFEKYAGDIWDDLATTAGGQIAAGGDVDPGTGADRLFLRGFGTQPAHTLTLPDPGKGVRQYKRDQDGRDITNALWLKRRTSSPNLLDNGSFEEPVLASEDTANLLLNPSFEVGSVDNGDAGSWNRAGGATAKHRGTGTGEPDPLEGEWHVETDHTGEHWWQDVSQPIPTGHTARFVVYCRPEDATTAEGIIRIYFDTGSGFGAAAASTIVIPAGLFYSRFVVDAVAPSGVVGVRVEMECTTGSTTHGLLWDRTALFDASILYQSAWRVEAQGTAVIDSQEWVVEDAFHGGYSSRFEVTPGAVDTDGQGVRLRPIDPISVESGRAYQLRFGFKTPASGTKYLRAGVDWYDSAGALITGGALAGVASYQIPVDTVAITDWRLQQPSFSAPATAASAVPYLEMRSTHTWQFDAVSFRRYSAGELWPSGYVDGDTTIEVLRADDPHLGLTGAPSTSIADNGYLPEWDELTPIATDFEADQYGAAVLTQRAVEYDIPEVVVTNERAAVAYWPGELVRAIGRDGADFFPAARPITEVQIDWDGGQGLSQTLSFTTRPASETLTQRRIARDVLRRSLAAR